MPDLVYLDVETTGLDPARHDIWEIGYALGDGPIEVSYVEHELRTADPAALRIGNYEARVTRGAWQAEALQFELRLKDVLGGATIVGANPAFDTAFLRARWGIAPWRYRLLDIEVYAMSALGLAAPMGLAFIAELLGVAAPDHTAAGDVAALREVHRKLVAKYAAATRSDISPRQATTSAYSETKPHEHPH